MMERRKRRRKLKRDEGEAEREGKRREKRREEVGEDEGVSMVVLTMHALISTVTWSQKLWRFFLSFLHILRTCPLLCYSWRR